MALQNLNTLQFADRPFFQPFILERVPFINGGGTTRQAIRPLENLRNRYYAMSASQGNFGMSQSNMIARTNPAVRAKTSPVALDASGMGSTYRITDEALRQYSLGTYLHNAGMSYYQIRP